MAYTINRSDGSVFAVIADGTINTDSTLVLPGKNYSGYGEFLNENFFKLLESGASTIQPPNPEIGQLWFDKTSNALKVFNGSLFRELGLTSTSPTPPSGTPGEGDTWWDTVNKQLKVWDSASNTWLVVGPSFTAATGVTGAITDIITDTLSVDHIVIKFFVEDLVLAIMSSDPTFTPSPAIPGFTTIKPGLNFASTINSQTLIIDGTVQNALTLDGFASSDFVKKVGPGEEMQTSLSVRAANGLRVGVNQDFRARVVSTNHVKLENVTSGGALSLTTVGGDAITISAAAATQINGVLTCATHVNPTTNNVSNLGTSSTRWNTVYATTFNGTATTALYADLAEKFVPDARYSPGTLVMLGGSQEVTKVVEEASEDVLGVVSTDPAYLMNAGITGIPVAMVGRVPARVVGMVKRNDRLISAGNGVARAAKPGEATPFNVIGRAMEDKTTAEEGLVEVVVVVK